ncbi:MAG: enoyl-CoA hydratase/isomerase family protein [Chloroflexi bacterium]|nr:enoyl-CoA hydratase/isomerase family protein [Chloroflexota bacterium]
MSVLLYEKRDHVAHVTLNRPEKLNAINIEMRDSLRQAFIQVRDDPDVWVAIVAGAGRAFSSGHDLGELHAEGRTPSPGWDQPFFPLPLKVWKPLIAAIDGYAVAGGLSLALECDIRVCTERSFFANTEHRIGRLADLPPLAEMMPMGNALYMTLTGAQIPASEALRWGLVYKVLPDKEAMMQEAQRIAEEIKMCAPLAVQAVKRVFYETQGLPPEHVDRMVKALDPLIMQTEDALEGPRAFVEKRKPLWKAR